MTDLNFSFVIEKKIIWRRGLELGDWLQDDHNKPSERSSVNCGRGSKDCE